MYNKATKNLTRRLTGLEWRIWKQTNRSTVMCSRTKKNSST